MRQRLAELTPGVHLDVMIGNPGHMIAERAEELDAGLIVIPSHGRTGLKHIVFGSVAERVVSRAGCPVLTVRSCD